VVLCNTHVTMNAIIEQYHYVLGRLIRNILDGSFNFGK
jgi:hypothetical protein